jgi:DNA-binding CsgD family transcriptional regulator
MTQPTGWNALTETERRVAELVADGLTNRNIGERLLISRYTVDYHIRQICRRLAVSTRAGLAWWVVAAKHVAFAMFDGVTDGITVLEPIWDEAREIADFRIVYANAASIDPFGRHVSDLVGQRLREAYPTNATGAYFARVYTSGEPLELRDFELEGTIDGVRSVTRFEVRATRHQSHVVVAYRAVGSDRAT